jgi:hypothetical protein
VSLEDDEGNVIKEKDYGRAYLADIDMRKATEDWWETHFYNYYASKYKVKKRKFTRDSNEVYKIVDILSNALRRTLFGRFLCESRKEIAARIEKDFEDYKENE